ncbi:MAG: hypothetical protein IJR27_01275, partial [Synergistaceae bacterium]|nr:hypothetical protein [Synergistaceae bacterium]
PDIYVSESPFFTFNFFRGIHSDAFIQSVMQSGRYALTVLFSSLNDNSQHESIHFTHDIKRDISSFLDWSMSEPSSAAHDFFRAFICDLRPYWDVQSWLEHSIWTEEPEQQPIAQCIETPLEVSLEYTDIPTWSSRKTWAGSDTWIHSAEQSGFCDFSNLILEEAK